MQKKLKLLFIIPTLGGGGAEVMLGAIMEEFYRRGHELLLVTLYPMHHTFNNFPNKDFILENIPIVETRTRVEFSLFGVKCTDNHFQSIVEEFQPNVIHSHLFEADIIARSFIYPNCQYFAHGHDNMPQLERFNILKLLNRQHLTNLIERKWIVARYKETDTKFIAISKDVFNFLHKNLQKSLRKNIYFQANAISISRFTNISGEFKTVDTSKPLRIVSIGNLVSKKNHTFLVKIAIELKKRTTNFSIDILGFGLLKECLDKEIKRNQLSEHVFLRGNVNNVPEYLAKSDIYVHPATYEPFGLVLLEAMASGLPVVCLDGKGNRDLIIQGKNGYIFTEENAVLFAETILKLWKDKVQYLEMKAYAKEFVKSFDIHRYVDRLLELYLID